VPRVGQELFYMPTNFAEIGGTLRSLANSGGKFGLGGQIGSDPRCQFAPQILGMGSAGMAAHPDTLSTVDGILRFEEAFPPPPRPAPQGAGCGVVTITNG
jgi:hypothetical protein